MNATPILRTPLALVVLAAGGCASGFLAPPEIERPDEAVVVVYTHGSGSSTEPDPCYLAEDGWPGTPEVLVRLDRSTHDGLEIVVHRFCTPSRTGESFARIHPNPMDLRFAKVVRRANDLIDLAREYRDSGVPPERIVLTGHSTGGFAALLAQARAPDLVGKVIAFAPAFAGPRIDRPAESEWANELLKQEVATADGLNAMVFAYEGDTHEPPGDIALWQENPGIQLLALPSHALDGERCRLMAAHRLTFDPCFTLTQRERILSFILEEGEGTPVSEEEAP